MNIFDSGKRRTARCPSNPGGTGNACLKGKGSQVTGQQKACAGSKLWESRLQKVEAELEQDWIKAEPECKEGSGDWKEDTHPRRKEAHRKG